MINPTFTFHTFTLSLVHVADVAGENLVHLVDEHEHVAVLFYNSLDKSTKKVRVVMKQNSWTYLSSDMKENDIDGRDAESSCLICLQVLSEMGEMETADLDVEIVR